MTQKAELFLDCRCELAEGPFWHPLLGRLFWFDILNRKMLSVTEGGEIVDDISFEHHPAAAAVIDGDSLAVATGPALIRHQLSTGARTYIAAIEPDKPGNRSNDSRVHQSGAFWLGTMSQQGDRGPGAGAVYHYRAGKIAKLMGDITIPNSICFSPDGATAYFTDTLTGVIQKRPLDVSTGEPTGPFEVFADTNDLPGLPDGSVVDSEGFLWNARYNGYRIIRFAPDGRVDREVEVPVARVTCPAFGGADMRTLYVTTAREHADAAELAREPTAGGLFSVRVDVAGLAEPMLAL